MPPITSADKCSTELQGHTRDSTSRTRYRHFAVDDTHKIVYFCDLNPYKEGMFCYCSDRSTTGTNVWNGEYDYFSNTKTNRLNIF